MTETRNKQNSRESRQQYTWFFSGEGGRNEYTAGVGIVIDNEYLQHIDDIEPITDRLMYITLKGAITITIVVAYMPPADRPEEEKTKAYQDLQQLIDKRKSKGPLYIMGDWNARLMYPITAEEEEIMGRHTMHTDGNQIHQLPENMRENKDLLTELCMTNELRVANTMYRKPKDETATYRIKKERPT